MEEKKVGIIGSGAVAQTLAIGFLKHSYEVMIGSRDTGKLNDWKVKINTNVKVGSNEEAAQFGTLIVLAVKGIAAEKVVKSLSGTLNGKTVLDTTNPIAEAPPDNGVLKYFTDLNLSLMEKLQEIEPGANFVKAFNSVGNAAMVNPSYKEGKPTMFICGNSDTAKAEAKKVLDQFGWDVADLGKATSARAIEPLCMLWCIPGFLKNQWSHAFKLLQA